MLRLNILDLPYLFGSAFDQSLLISCLPYCQSFIKLPATSFEIAVNIWYDKDMKKVIIIGCPGSGKSTLARKLSHMTRLPFYHLDLMNWQPNKTTVAPEIFFERQKQVLEKKAWIIDGNYGSSLELRFEGCDTIVFLDYPLEVCLEGVMNRVGIVRPDMPWVEETLDDDFLDFIRGFPKTNRPKIVALINRYSHKTCFWLKSREDADSFLQTIKKIIPIVELE